MAESNRIDEIDACNESGRQCIEKGDLSGACEAFTRALEMLQQSPHAQRQAIFLNNLGHVLVGLDRRDEALERFQEAGRLCESLGDRTGLAWQLGNVGSVYRDKEEHEAALESYRKALTIFEEQEDRIGIADQYSNIGYIHARKREREIALEWFQKSKALYESLGEERKASLAEQNIQILAPSGDR
jgi:tetratricopeptide (TPR) repeat protein